ncbi:hypothetical protein GCM10027435_04250 [Haloparvum alkalitolerans]|uniref:lipid II:glycine glycyltransferase FemX n=1 Tax=Haloparvum alkalitolerans TaxID=1042953 RepID=UPI003CF04539
MTVEIFTENRLNEWQELYDSLEHAGSYHDPRYMSLLAGGFEQESEFAEAFVYTTDDAFVYYPYIRRTLSELPFEVDDIDGVEYSDIVSSWYYGGPVASVGADEDTVDAFLEEFSDYCRRENIVSEFVRFDPNLENHETFEALDPSFNRETVRVDLTQSLDDIWDDFEKRNRNAIRQAQETDIVVEPTTDPDDYAAFHDIYTDAMKAQDAAKHYRFPLSFFEALLAEDDLATLSVARYEGEVIGGSFVVHDDDIAHDYLRASDPDYWDLRVNNLICYESLMEMRRTGRELFDFQGGRPGVFKFKRGFSESGRGEFHIAKQVHIDDVYDTLVDAASDSGVDTESGYFPAYRVEQSN